MESCKIDMIPKIIHYCWFGGKPLPKDAEKCVLSWKKFFPDYEIKRWDESNFDVNSIQYTEEAYRAGKYAFVSDYARFWILYKYGGLYFDTDVEVIRSLDDIVRKGNFLGVEQQNDTMITVAPGLGFGVSKNHPFFAEMISKYQQSHFLCPDGSFCLKNIVEITTESLLNKGLKNTADVQECYGFTIYPKDFFCPIDYQTRELKVTDNTRTIHHYAESWVPRSTKVKNLLGRFVGKQLMGILVYLKQRINNLIK